MKRSIDINADLGEGTGIDAALMPYLSSCNIACGGHFGTDESMRETVGMAKLHGVKIGAHPSFPDRDNFGRKVMSMTKESLTDSIYFQLLKFLAVCESEEVKLNHIKLHGALYNYAAKDAPTSDAVVEAITQLKMQPILYVPYNSVLHKKAENLLPLCFEAFIDRRYDDSGALVPRKEAGALIVSAEEAWRQLKLMVLEGKVITGSGKKIPVQASTYCIHGDTPDSVEILKYLRKMLSNLNIEVA